MKKLVSMAILLTPTYAYDTLTEVALSFYHSYNILL